MCLPLSKGEGISQRRPSGCNVHRAATSEVQRRQVVQPTVGIPRPTRNGTVHDRGPEEPEDEGRDDASTLKRATNHNLHSAGAEKELVETESDIRDRRVADRRGSDDIAQPKVSQVTDEGTCRAAVSQRKAPEHPLEGGDCSNHQRLEKKGEGRLPAGKATVQESDAGYNEPHYEGAEDQVRVVVLEAHVLGVHVHLERVATSGH